MSSEYRGSCLCGAVRFAVEEFDPQVAHCHCSMCRKFHGASFATIAGVPRDRFRLISGDDRLQRYTAANGTTRSFCRTCGSSLFFSSPRAPSDVVEIALGAFDGDLPVRPDAHIFVGSAASWTAFTDELPRYVEGRGGAREPLRFDLFGRELLVERRGDAWKAFYPGPDGTRRAATDIVLPPDVGPGELVRCLDELCHEQATPRHPRVVRLD